MWVDKHCILLTRTDHSTNIAWEYDVSSSLPKVYSWAYQSLTVGDFDYRGQKRRGLEQTLHGQPLGIFPLRRLCVLTGILLHLYLLYPSMPFSFPSNIVSLFLVSFKPFLLIIFWSWIDYSGCGAR